MIKEGAMRTEKLPAMRIAPIEKEMIESRMEVLGFKKFSQYIRYCINKEMEGK